ncbi:hypothetical protein EV715DRAFT_268535 [Schizophyllum commune]
MWSLLPFPLQLTPLTQSNDDENTRRAQEESRQLSEEFRAKEEELAVLQRVMRQMQSKTAWTHQASEKMQPASDMRTSSRAADVQCVTSRLNDTGHMHAEQEQLASAEAQCADYQGHNLILKQTLDDLAEEYKSARVALEGRQQQLQQRLKVTEELAGLHEQTILNLTRNLAGLKVKFVQRF